MTETKQSGYIRLFILFVLWYAFNAGYNVYNAYCKRDTEFPVFLSLIQLCVGFLYALPIWILGIRKPPKLTFQDIITLLPIILLNSIGHYTGVVAMFQKGGGSFTHVIKASEPVVSVVFCFLFLGVNPKPFTALSLLPITYGVAYASTLGNLSWATISSEMTSITAMYAMASNITFSIRSIARKQLTSDFKTRTNLTPANEHAVTTIASAILLIPLTLALEDPKSISDSILRLEDRNVFFFNVFVCGMCFYLYNEMQNIVLSSLGAVQTAVGNTLKRVVIFVALYYCTSGEVFPWPKIVGCIIALVGCLLFAIFDAKKI